MATQSKTPPTFGSLAELLEQAAHTSSKCFFHSQDSVASKTPMVTLSYADLLALARDRATRLLSLLKEQEHKAESPSTVVLLHFDSIEDNVIWFWASILAGISPAISTPLPASPDQREKHLTHLSTLFSQPIVLARESSLPLLQGIPGFQVVTIETLGKQPADKIELPVAADPNIYVLTSGSSGNAKAVELRSRQIHASLHAKHETLGSRTSDVFLNWIGFDHVANLTESHLFAMYLGVDQHHISAADVISNPTIFLRLISENRITITFAPNFFLSRLVQAANQARHLSSEIDLSSLRIILSGGEANLVETSIQLDTALQAFGAGADLVFAGFGMSETCAGCIHSSIGNAYDSLRGREFATLGKPSPGLRMRVTKDDGALAGPNEMGILEISGPMVFDTYLNNEAATKQAFTKDGYFITGDKAFIDENGCLYLSGRDKEIININGQKYAPHELESALEEAIQGDSGIVPSYTMVFSTRPPNAQREDICVIYHPVFDPEDVDKRITTANAITQIIGLRTSARPKHIIALPKCKMPKSSLGKLSRSKLRDAFEQGQFQQHEDRHNHRIREKRHELSEPPKTETEKLVVEVIKNMLADVLDDASPIAGNASIFELGITSTDLFILSSQLRKRLELTEKIDVGTFFTDPTIRGIATALDGLGREDDYVPIVPLQQGGDKTPLFLVHPGSGDVLVFVALSKYFTDRPVYGIRTRCLYSGDNYHTTIHSMAQCYYEHIKKIQPEGPYAVAGYSLGSSVAYEIARLLEADGSKVPFLGILDSPPHIKHLIVNQDFIEVLLNVAYFLELITEEYTMVESIAMHKKTPSEALDLVLQHAPPDRLKSLSIDKPRLQKITEVTMSFGAAAKDYDPSGTVGSMDIFWVHPLLSVAPNRQEWMEKHLTHWVNFCRNAPQYHELPGNHSLMLNGTQLDTTARKIRAVIRYRGL